MMLTNVLHALQFFCTNYSRGWQAPLDAILAGMRLCACMRACHQCTTSRAEPHAQVDALWCNCMRSADDDWFDWSAVIQGPVRSCTVAAACSALISLVLMLLDVQ
jgi:hypothetical protein